MEYPDKVKLSFLKYTPKKRKDDAISPGEPGGTAQATAEISRTPEEKAHSQAVSIARAKRQLADLIECNPFDKFATLTFNPAKHDAYNVDECLRKASRFLANQKRLYGDFRYVMVMEPMKDGKVHFHLLLGGFTGKYHKTNVRGTGENKRQCYKIDAWEKNYGFADMEDIGNKEAVARYVGKYIVKEISHPLQGKGAKRYYASKNLMRPKKTYNVRIDDLAASGKYDMKPVHEYENEYISQSTFKKL